MAQDRRTLVAAVFNTSPDIVDLLRQALEPAGIVAVSVMTHQIREGAVNVEAFLQQHNPQVVVYDIAPPYEANWHLFQHICEMDAMRDRQVVLASTNAQHAERLGARKRKIFKVIGKPRGL